MTTGITGPSVIVVLKQTGLSHGASKFDATWVDSRLRPKDRPRRIRLKIECA